VSKHSPALLPRGLRVVTGPAHRGRRAAPPGQGTHEDGNREGLETLAVELGLRAKRDVPGYHPVVVPHGYQSYYFNVMAGPKRAWHFRNDPVHDWMFSAA
jgi:hypothetical protein